MHGNASGHHGDPSSLPASVTVSVTAVLLALISLLGHRAHTHTILIQNQSLSAWLNYQAKAAGRTSYDALLDFLQVAQLRNPENAQKVKEEFEQKIREIDEQRDKVGASASALEQQALRQEVVANRFDLGSVFLEAALVVMSLTLLTKRQLYWGIGLGLTCVGLVVAATGFWIS